MLARLKNHKCCGGVIRRQREPSSFAGSEPKSPVEMTMMPPGLRWRSHRASVVARVRQVLDDVEHDDDVEHAEAGQASASSATPEMMRSPRPRPNAAASAASSMPVAS